MLHLNQLISRLRGLDEDWNDLADRMGTPREFILCPHCGAQRWRLPPHNLESCPVVVKMADSAGLKFDAERMNTIRAGHHMEAVQRLLENQVLPDSDEEEET